MQWMMDYLTGCQQLGVDGRPQEESDEFRKPRGVQEAAKLRKRMTDNR